MTDEEHVDDEELAAQDGEELPPREAMSLIDVGGEGGFMPLPEPIGADDEVGGGPGGRYTLPVEPPSAV